MSSSQRLRTLLTAAASIAALSGAHAAAAAPGEQRRFDVPAQDVGGAIQELARQADIQILVAAGLVPHVKAPALRGRFDMDTALARLIGGTPLQVLSNDGRTIVLGAQPVRQAEPRTARAIPAAYQLAAGAEPAAPAASQLAAAAPAPAAGLQEVVVTAQRSESTLQRTPVSVAAISATALASRGITDVIDLQTVVPGLRFQSEGSLIATIRGVGTFSIQPGVDSSVAYSVDGVSLPHPSALIPIAFDLQRVEVLRGPQGTLFGRNTNAGAINQITNKPIDSFEARAQVGFGNYNLISTEAMINAPITDKLYARAAFASAKHDAYLDNGFEDNDIMAGRVSLFYKASDKVDLQVNGDTSYSHGHGWSNSPCPPNGDVSVYPKCAGVPWRPYSGLPGQSQGDYLKIRNSGVYAQLNVDLGFGKLVYIPSYRQTYFTELNTGNPTTRYFPQEHDKYHTEEVRIDSPSSSRIKWVAGVFYSRETLRSHALTFNNNPGALVYLSNVLDINQYSSRSLAAFAQVTYPVTDTFRVTGGIRYTDEHKFMAGQAGAYCLNAPGTPFDPTCAATYPSAPALKSVPTGADGKLDKATWKAGFEFDVAPRSMLYGSVSTGFKSGGINNAPTGFGIPPTYGPETITAFQGGMKNRFFDNRLQLNGEVFHYDYKGYQTLASQLVPPGILVFETANAQKSRFTGGELEASILATPDDRIDLSLAIVHAKHIDFRIASNGANNSGKTVANAPPLVLTGTYEKTFRLANGARIVPQVTGTYSDGYYTELTNNRSGFQDSYFQADAGIRYRPANDKWSVNAWIRNMGNTAVIYGASVSKIPTGQDYAPVNPPRTFGVTFTANIN